MDFGSLTVPEKKSAPTDPIKIFESLPRLDQAINDLWRGQTDALRQWDAHRDSSDTLVSLNTGAGKTLVGLLMAQSLVNEGLNNVLYVCPTNDLVLQTKGEADRFGIRCTTRTDQNFDNDLFETGKAFCITNYHAIFNGLSGIRRKYFPQAILFGDAHVAESILRNSYSIHLNIKDDQELYLKIAARIEPFFNALERGVSFRDAYKQDRSASASSLVPPDVIARLGNEITILLEEGRISAHKSNKWTWPNIKDHIHKCAFVFRGGNLEISPPFLPTLAMDIFSERVRRVYLSATLQNKADLVRAFGRIPDEIVEPENDAGNGERLIIQERSLNNTKVDVNFVKSILEEHKVVIAVPSYVDSRRWSALAEPPKREEFTAKLNDFRTSDRGVFALVSRTDGIDLPHDTCRVMVIDGIPMGESLLERYQGEYLRMNNFIASRVANRLVQLFGRINRGRNDYGAFLIAGHDLNVWMQREQNIARLPNLLRKQVVIGQHVQEGLAIRSIDKVKELFRTVLKSKPRDKAWVDYYADFMNRYDVSAVEDERAKLAERRNLASAVAEAQAARAMWQGDYNSAARTLDEVTADVARSDEKLAGWLSFWAGAANFMAGDEGEARYLFSRACSQLGNNLVVDRTRPDARQEEIALSKLGRSILELVSLRPEGIEKRVNQMRDSLALLDGATPKAMEESVRALGQFLGFASSRPDNDVGTGPDVLWVDEDGSTCLGLELKTDKEPGGTFFKKDIAQAHDHNSWLDNTQKNPLGTVLIGPAAHVANDANPDDRMFVSGSNVLVGLRDRLFEGIRLAGRANASDRLSFCATHFGSAWTLENLRRENFGHLVQELPRN